MARYCGCGCGRVIEHAHVNRRWATDNCRKRWWDEANGRFCVDCGKTWLTAAQVRVAKRKGHPGRCDDCRKAHDRWIRDRKIELVAGMYEDAWPLADIAAVFGRSHSSGISAGNGIGPELDGARKRGLIGYRYQGYGRAAA